MIYIKNKGFTLIELLAVIVILSIIALIATPVILGIINDVREESNKRSIEMYAKAIENAVALNQLTSNKNAVGSFNTQDGKKLILIEEEEPSLIVDYDGNVVCDIIEIYADGTIYLANCKVNGEEVEYEYGKRNVPEPKSFATDSWETIAKAVRENNTYMYKVGDTREIELEGFENEETDENGDQIKTYTIRLSNKTNTGDVCTKEYFEKNGIKEIYSKTACGFVIEFEDIIYSTKDDAKMNLTATNVGGWKDSKMRTYINSTIYNALPEELRDVIIDTTVVSGHGYDDTKNKVTTDKVYLLSTGEVWEQGISKMINYDTARDNTRQLDYYKYYKNSDGSIGVTTSNYLGAIKKINGNEWYWWLRSASSNNTNAFHIVIHNGDWSNLSANSTDTDGVAVAFRIG